MPNQLATKCVTRRWTGRRSAWTTQSATAPTRRRPASITEAAAAAAGGAGLGVASETVGDTGRGGRRRHKGIEEGKDPTRPGGIKQPHRGA